VSPRKWESRIHDMLACSRNILTFTTGMDFISFLGDAKTIRAVAFELTTIGEAVRAMPQEIQDKYPEIPWREMQSIRNILVHEYFHLDEEILWKTIQDDVPALIEELEKIID
jgi:uncharacterized protein with HEPN domain